MVAVALSCETVKSFSPTRLFKKEDLPLLICPKTAILTTSFLILLISFSIFFKLDEVSNICLSLEIEASFSAMFSVCNILFFIIFVRSKRFFSSIIFDMNFSFNSSFHILIISKFVEE